MRSHHQVVTVRAATEADREEIAAIALACGQPPIDSAADSPYVRHLLAHGTVAVAVNGERVVLGFGATRLIGSVSLLTDLFVSPTVQGGGIGRAILHVLWNGADENRVTFSSQHPSALPLYARFGLAPRWPLLYLTGSASQLEPSALTVVHASASAAALAEMELTGLDRHEDYEYWLRSDGASGLLISSSSKLVAVAAATAAGIAHLVCPSIDLAAEAVMAAVRACGPTTVTLCLPGPHPALPVLLERGFTIDDYDIQMSSDPSLTRTTSVYSPGLG